MPLDLLFSRARRRAGAPPQGASCEPNSFTSHQAGISPFESWFSGVVNQTGYVANAFGFGNIAAYPVTLGRGRHIDRIAFEVVAGAGSAVARCGIYGATSQANPYPGPLIVDGGEKDASTNGVKSTVVSLFLRAGIYYFAYIAGVASPSVRSIPSAGCSTMLGLLTTMGGNPNMRFSQAQAYGALPATFPTINVNNGTPPIVHVRFSS